MLVCWDKEILPWIPGKNKIEIAFDLHDFIFILIAGYFIINLRNKFYSKRKSRLEYNRNKFQIYHVNQLLFEIS